MENDIDIGISIDAKLYLHILDAPTSTPFIVKNIESVEEGELGTVINYIEPEIIKMAGIPSTPVQLIVSEPKDKIEQSMHICNIVRDGALKYTKRLVEELEKNID